MTSPRAPVVSARPSSPANLHAVWVGPPPGFKGPEFRHRISSKSENSSFTTNLRGAGVMESSLDYSLLPSNDSIRLFMGDFSHSIRVKPTSHMRDLLKFCQPGSSAVPTHGLDAQRPQAWFEDTVFHYELVGYDIVKKEDVKTNVTTHETEKLQELLQTKRLPESDHDPRRIINRRLLYVRDADRSTIVALVKTINPFLQPRIQQLIQGYFTKATQYDATAKWCTHTGISDFIFHLSSYALVEEDVRQDQRRWGPNQGPLRQRHVIPDGLSLRRGYVDNANEHRCRKFIQARRTSAVFSGLSDTYWSGHCFEDEFYQDLSTIDISEPGFGDVDPILSLERGSKPQYGTYALRFVDSRAKAVFHSHYEILYEIQDALDVQNCDDAKATLLESPESIALRDERIKSMLDVVSRVSQSTANIIASVQTLLESTIQTPQNNVHMNRYLVALAKEPATIETLDSLAEQLRRLKALSQKFKSAEEDVQTLRSELEREYTAASQAAGNVLSEKTLCYTRRTFILGLFAFAIALPAVVIALYDVPEETSGVPGKKSAFIGILMSMLGAFVLALVTWRWGRGVLRKANGLL